MEIYAVLLVIALILLIFLIRWIISLFKTDITLEKIEQLLLEKNYTGVVDLGIKHLKTHPSSFMVNQYMAKAYEGLFQYRHAIEHLERSLIILSNEGKSGLQLDIHNKLGELYYKINDFGGAIAYFNLVLKTSSRNMKALFLSGKIFYELKSFPMAKERLETYLSMKPREAVAMMLLAKTYYELGEFQKSLNILNQMLLADEDILISMTDDLYLLMAKNYFSLKSFSQAIPILKTLLEKKYQIEEVFNLIVFSLIKDKKLNAAVSVTNDYIMSVPQERRAEILYHIAQAYLDDSEVYRAVETWKMVYELNPKYLDIAEIMTRYKALLKNPVMENIFTTDIKITEEFLSRIFRISLESIVLKRKDFWVIKKDDELHIVHRQPVAITPRILIDMSDALKEQLIQGSMITVYTLFGIKSSCKEYTFYQKITEVSKEDFVRKFSSSIPG
jgi:tetratricopeptide (TPR) repeat protein